jgi:hypothetical protein
MENCNLLGFDHTLDFKPQLGSLPGAFNEGRNWNKLRRNLRRGIFNPGLTVYDYDEAISYMESVPKDFAKIPSVFVGWDNTPRRGKKSIVVRNGSPERFEKYLTESIDKAEAIGSDGKLVFINAWNEWAEGNHLEPDQKFGCAFLKAVRRAKNVARGLGI